MNDLETEATRLAKAYLRLGGTRKAKIDDNIVTTRKWENEPAAAQAFWEKEIASLPERRRTEVETFLPTINSI